MSLNTPEGSALFHVTRTEMQEHLTKRAEHHTARNAKLVAEGKKLDEDLQESVNSRETVSDRMEVKSSSNYSSTANDRDRKFAQAREHARLAARFFFLAKHTPAEGGVFELTTGELGNLEFFNE